MWEDWTIFIGTIVLLVPTTRNILNRKTQIARSSSVTIAGVLALFSVSFAGLGLWFSSVSEGAGAVMWLMLALWRNIK